MFRNNIDTLEKFADTDPLEFIKFSGIGFMSMSYILKKHSEARKMLELPEISEPGFEEISSKVKEKNDNALKERKIRNGWYEGADGKWHYGHNFTD